MFSNRHFLSVVRNIFDMLLHFKLAMNKSKQDLKVDFSHNKNKKEAIPLADSGSGNSVSFSMEITKDLATHILPNCFLVI